MNESFVFRSKERDLGGFSVYRALPNVHKRSIGPFVFLDHLGPMVIDGSHALDVRPHPHIGLSTVTYLFQGKGLHRDSLGNRKVIEPGDVNLMTAGSGIVHSERTPQEERVADGEHKLHGLQFWLALPKELEDCEPSFIHHEKSSLPEIALSKSIRGKLLIGKLGENSSPVVTPSPTFFMVIESDVPAEANLHLPNGEFGAFIASQAATVNGHDLTQQDLLIAGDSSSFHVKMNAGTRLVLFGGEPLPEKRFIWWNFVSTSSEKIRIAADKWKNQEMGKVAGESGFIPLPSDPLPK